MHHEEADTHLFLHALNAVQKGYRKLCVRTVDTDVVVLAISLLHHINAEELWLAFGTSSSFRYIPIHEVVKVMDPRTCMALSVFHSFTGCDTVSSFGGRGKKSAWNTWQVYPEVTGAFERLLLMEETGKTAMAALERFVVLLYDCTSDLLQVNDARKQLLPRSQGVWKTYHPHILLSKSMLNEPVIKHTAGTSPWFLILIFQVVRLGLGERFFRMLVAILDYLISSIRYLL